MSRGIVRMKRFLIAIIAVCMLVTFMPVTTFAETEEAEQQIEQVQENKDAVAEPEEDADSKATTETATKEDSAVEKTEEDTEEVATDKKEMMNPSEPETAAVPAKAKKNLLKKDARQGRDISDKAVTSLTVDKENGHYWNGNNAVITLNFAEMGVGGAEDLNIQGGDIIKVNWTTSDTKTENSWLEGTAGTKVFSIKNDKGEEVNVGEVVITKDGATITFNDSVNNLYNVKGFVQIQAKTMNYNGGDDTSTSTIKAGDKTTSVTVTGSTYSYKGIGHKEGWPAEGTHMIEWVFAVNQGFNTIESDYVIDEYIPEGQHLLANRDEIKKYYNVTPTVRELIKPTVEGAEAGKGPSYSGRTYEEALTQVGAKWEKISDSHYRITFPKEVINGKHFRFTVYTYADYLDEAAAGDYKVPNNYTQNVTYTEPGSTSTVTADGNMQTASANVHKTSAGIQGLSPSAIKITKKTPTGKVIEGISFTLTRKDGGKMNDKGDTSIVVKTDSNGEALVKNLYDGEYVFSENVDTTPNWIQLPEVNGTKKGVTVDATVNKAAKEGESLVAVNMPKIIEKDGMDVEITKTWIGADGQEDAGEHPTTYFQLYRQVEGGSPEKAKYMVVDEVVSIEGIEEKQVTKAHEEDVDIYKMENGETTHKFKSDDPYNVVGAKLLPAYDDSGNKYTYTVKEVDAEGNDAAPKGYTKKEDGLNVTNTKIATSVKVKKVWDDADDQDGMRTNSVKVTLFKGDEAVGEPVTLDESNGWTATFDKLPKYDLDGNEIEYTVKEDAVEGYETEISGSTADGYTITNKHTPETTQVSVMKVWDDADDQDGLRPDSVQVQLYADGEAYGEAVTLNKDNSWAYVWEELNLNNKGSKIEYTVKEVTEVAGYETEVTGDATEDYTITNKHTPKPPVEEKTPEKDYHDKYPKESKKTGKTVKKYQTKTSCCYIRNGQ